MRNDLSGYDRKQLIDLLQKIEAEIGVRQHQEVQKAREQIFAIVHEVGVPIEELLAIPGLQTGKNSLRPRFQNPNDKTQTWTGRGRQPRWIGESLAGGRKLDEFRI